MLQEEHNPSMDGKYGDHYRCRGRQRKCDPHLEGSSWQGLNWSDVGVKRDRMNRNANVQTLVQDHRHHQVGRD